MPGAQGPSGLIGIPQTGGVNVVKDGTSDTGYFGGTGAAINVDPTERVLLMTIADLLQRLVVGLSIMVDTDLMQVNVSSLDDVQL
jgi:hypothetical protein